MRRGDGVNLRKYGPIDSGATSADNVMSPKTGFKTFSIDSRVSQLTDTTVEMITVTDGSSQGTAAQLFSRRDEPEPDGEGGFESWRLDLTMAGKIAFICQPNSSATSLASSLAAKQESSSFSRRLERVVDGAVRRFENGRLPRLEDLSRDLDHVKGLLVLSPDGRLVQVRYRMGLDEPNKISVEVIRGPVYSRPIRSLDEFDDPSWMYPCAPGEWYAYGKHMRDMLSRRSCAMERKIKEAWIAAIGRHQPLLKSLIEDLLPGIHGKHGQVVTIGAAIKYFQYCLWSRAIVRSDPGYLANGFGELRQGLIDPWLQAGELGRAGVPIHTAAKYMGGICENPPCRAKGWSAVFCGRCRQGVRIRGPGNQSEIACSDYLYDHQSLVINGRA